MKKFVGLVLTIVISMAAAQAMASRTGAATGSGGLTKAPGFVGPVSTMHLVCVYQSGTRIKSIWFGNEDPIEPVYLTINMGSGAVSCPATYQGYPLSGSYWVS